MNLIHAAAGVERSGRAAAIALGATIPCSVALDNLLLAVILLCWLAGGAYREKWTVARSNPVGSAALLFTSVIFGALAWSDASGAYKTALKYLDLAFIPLFLHYFRDSETRRLGLMAFAGMSLLILFLSLLVKAGALPHGGIISGSVDSPVVFKFRITHNFLMSFGALIFVWFAFTDSTAPRIRTLWAILALAAAVNVLLMVEGATGQLILVALALWLIIARLPGRTRMAALIAAAAAIAALIYVPGPIASRVDAFQRELSQWQPGVGQRHSSSGLRLEFFGNSASIIAERPLLGVGTGGFPAAYAKQVAGTDMLPTTNPHNEYLMITAQTGLVGLMAMLALFIVSWRCAIRLPTAMETGLARGLVIAMAIGCLFNSFLLDHAEGLFFAWMSGLLFAGYRSDTPTGQSA
ncbi:MAG: O-antigen ligase family protein [Betaproteobacteria bacterium]